MGCHKNEFARNNKGTLIDPAKMASNVEVVAQCVADACVGERMVASSRRFSLSNKTRGLSMTAVESTTEVPAGYVDLSEICNETRSLESDFEQMYRGYLVGPKKYWTRAPSWMQRM
jgi:hypothetical protein